MMVDDIKRNLEVSFNQNPSFKAENLSRDNTVEDKIFSYAIKMTSQFTLDLNNFYEKMKTFELRPLSIYANKGLVSYDVKENIGYINKDALINDENNDYNIDNLFTQIMLMVTTSRDNYYGFGSESTLSALNDACTYMIASNLSGASLKNNLEEELDALNLFDDILEGSKMRINFINAYFSNNGSILKEEINKCGISDDILNRINYFNQSKLSNLRLPGEFADIVNDINKASAKLLNNGVLSEEGMDNIISWQFSDDVLDNSTVGLTKSRENLINFVNYYKENQSNMVRQNQQVMSKVA